ncbi:MAG: HD domain-containing protein [Defluviitaleaceae bacterium]|nr:HD domain-containing protein [Defluviitaleaceae bacterium]
MHIYEKYRAHPEINRILDAVNQVNADIFSACHGQFHAAFVVEKTAHILTLLSYSARVVELGKIAALLHDIGNIAGRKKHPRKGAALAAVFLEDETELSPEEKTIIIQAIEDHSKGKNIQSAVGAALLIADKIDISRERVLPRPNLDSWHKNLLEIKMADVTIVGKTMKIHYTTTRAFSRELLESDYEKGFRLPRKAAAFLGYGCEFIS